MLVDLATKLREHIGDGIIEDHNVFLEQVDAALKILKLKPGAADLKALIAAVSWQEESAPPVIKKIHKASKIPADPIHGLYAVEGGHGSPSHPSSIVEYKPDSELRDYEQIPLLELLSVSHKTGVRPRSQKNATMFLASTPVLPDGVSKLLDGFQPTAPGLCAPPFQARDIFPGKDVLEQFAQHHCPPSCFATGKCANRFDGGFAPPSPRTARRGGVGGEFLNAIGSDAGMMLVDHN